MHKKGVAAHRWSELFDVFKQNAGAVFLLSFFGLFSIHLFNSSQAIFGSVDEISFSEFGLIDIPVLFFLAVGWSLVFVILNHAADRFSGKMFEGSQNQFAKRFLSMLFEKRAGAIVFAIVILAAWLPYVLSWCPGGIYADTWVVIKNIQAGVWSNRHTFFYEAIWWMLITVASGLGKGLVFASALMTFVQLVTFASILSYSVRWLNRWCGFRQCACMVVFALYCLVPAFPLFAISLWKDSFFTASLFLYSLKYIEVFFSKKASFHNTWVMCLLVLMVSFTRGNGVYVAVGSIAVLFIVKRKELRHWRQFFLLLATILFAVLVVQGPVYSLMGASSPIEENLGVPLQQIGAVISNGGNLSESQMSYFDSILPIDVWREAYRPFVVDSVKWDADFNVDVISEDPVRFFKEYILLGISNPGIYFESFFLNNAGFWDPFIGYHENVACYQWAMWSNVPVDQYDLVNGFTGISLRDLLQPHVFPTGGIFAWIMIIAVSMCASLTKRGSAAFAFTPLILVWLTLMIATPLAMSMRYFFIGVFMAPICMLLPVSLAQRKRSEDASKSKQTDAS